MSVNEFKAAQDALEERWQQLALLLDEAKKLQEDRNRHDEYADLYRRWLNLFEEEIAAVQTVHEAAESGAKLSVEDLRTAREVAEKLLDIMEQARARLPEYA